MNKCYIFDYALVNISAGLVPVLPVIPKAEVSLIQFGLASTNQTQLIHNYTRGHTLRGNNNNLFQVNLSALTLPTMR